MRSNSDLAPAGVEIVLARFSGWPSRSPADLCQPIWTEPLA
jgi:hypothetical protein